MTKYRIADIIKSKAPKERQPIRKKIRERLKWSKVVFSRHVHNVTDTKGSQLAIIAEILECEVADLYEK